MKESHIFVINLSLAADRRNMMAWQLSALGLRFYFSPLTVCL
jgi:hypothetical protein